MKTRSYGTVRMSADKQGGLILKLPKALVRDFGIVSGEFASLRAQKESALHLRFFRKVGDRWLQLLPCGGSRALPRRPVTQYQLEILPADEAPTPRQRRRIEAAITTQIRHYTICRELTRDIDRQVFRAGMAAFRSDATLALWLCGPCRALGDKVPLRIMRSARGRQDVTQILNAMAQGHYM